ncbi:hypothetical protein [Spirosoma endbachense]|uniref:Uncharacterized protein n=1 Tax=Spirosoma endbachense TaxID=2666025 RepID=A0A6P1VZY3_9BACT|nr:hypothetical protein [Spirosoma endbachense]QHV97878.1 hypothetical protein GJR95_23990 [Spirosoma endbachense]
MAEMLDSDRYDDSRDALTQCMYCGDKVAQQPGISSVGKCARHEAIWQEDIQVGLHKQNRLKEIILRSKPTSP